MENWRVDILFKTLMVKGLRRENVEKLQKYLPLLHKPHQKFIIKTVEGIIKSGTVMMTEMGRECRNDLKSASSLKYIKRNLENDTWSDKEVYQHYWSQLNGQFVMPTSVISVDLGDITKAYATSIQQTSGFAFETRRF